MRNPCPRFGKQIDFMCIKLDTMGVPNIISRPTQILGILPRPTAKFFQAIGHIFVILGQMRVQKHTFVTRQKRRVAHQITADRKR